MNFNYVFWQDPSFSEAKLLCSKVFHKRNDFIRWKDNQNPICNLLFFRISFDSSISLNVSENRYKEGVCASPPAADSPFVDEAWLGCILSSPERLVSVKLQQGSGCRCQ